MLRGWMQIAGAPGLRDLTGHVVSDQSERSMREVDQPLKVETDRQADLVAEIDEVLAADIAGGAGREGTSAEAAQRRVEAARARVKGRQHIDEAKSSRVVKMQRE